jgi:alcohol dehydrogenase class IV
MAVNDPEDGRARLDMLLGAFLAGVTLRYSGGGVAGALSYPLGAEFGIPHGLAGGLLVPHIVRLNVEGGYDGYADLERRLSLEDPNPRTRSESRAFIERVAELFAVIGAPSDFGSYPVTRRDISHIVDQAKTQRAPLLAANPVTVDNDFLAAVLQAVIPA